jgi:hypothetical protein
VNANSNAASDNSESLNSIASRLRFVRELGGLTARSLDRLARRTEGHCNFIEKRPDARVHADTVADFAIALGVTTDYLIRGVGEPPTEESVRAAIDRCLAQQVARRSANDSARHAGARRSEQAIDHRVTPGRVIAD